MQIKAITAIAAALALSLAASAASAEAERTLDTAKVIAVQLHKQGVVCTMPRSATRDTKLSKPNAAVWIVLCEEASYRVKLIPRRQASIVAISTDAPARVGQDSAKQDNARQQSECRLQCTVREPASPSTSQ
jgi:hypothetical protein